MQTQVRNPKYNGLGTVDMELNHPIYGWIAFTASPDDVEAYGRELYSQVIAGDFGSIEPYVPPPPHIASAEENKIEAERRLAATDWVNQPDVYDTSITPHLSNRNEYLSYRSAIRSIMINSVDGNIDWPIEPIAIWNQ